MTLGYTFGDLFDAVKAREAKAACACWTPERVAQLRVLCADGMTYNRIGLKIGVAGMKAYKKARDLGINNGRTKRGGPQHGQTKTAIWSRWRHMRERCQDEGRDYYAARGIKVCAEWENSFLAFKAWAEANGFHPSLTLDRINTDGDYEPSNCRWVDNKTQIRNRRCTQRTFYKGAWITLGELAELSGISAKRLYARIIQDGWSAERAVSTPVMTAAARRAA